MNIPHPYRIIDHGEYPVEGILPPVLTNAYEFRRLQIEGTPVVGVKPREGLPPLLRIKQHIRYIHHHMPGEALMICSHVLPILYQAAFLQEGVAYQELRSGSIYLPFMGLLYKGYSEPKPMTPLAQQLALLLISSGSTRLYSHGLADSYQVTPMAISTAFRVLADIEGFRRDKEGRLLYLETALTGMALFQQIRSHLFSPVHARMYIKQEDLPAGAPCAGESALSKLTELAPPSIPCHAIARKEAGNLQTFATLPAWEGYVQIELWRYSPLKLSKDGIVDPYSLLLSMKEDPDPRLQQALDNLHHQLS